MRVNAMTEQFEDVTVLGHPMIFTCLRVDQDTVPDGLYMYEVRQLDHGQSLGNGYLPQANPTGAKPKQE